MNPPPRAVFRCDASRHIGGGHAIRCLSLAQALSNAGWNCKFAVNPGACDTIPALRRDISEIEVLTHDPCSEAEELMACWPSGVDLLIVDHYGRDVHFEKLFSSWAKTILAIDDLANRGHACNLLLDQSLGRRAEDYAALVPSGCRLLMGPQYALLRPQFSAARSRSLSKRRSIRGIQRILISVGAADPDNFTDTALEGISLAQLDAEVDVVLGSDEKKSTLSERIMELEIDARIHVGVENMAELMASADLSIGAAGSTSWERCALGLPSLIVVTAENQRNIAIELAKVGAAQLLGDVKTVTSGQIAKALRSLQPEELNTMSIQCAQVCDAQGAARVASILTNLQNETL